MVVKLKELAENLNSSIEELTGLLKKLEFDYDEKNLEVDEDIAELLEDEIGTTKSDIENIAENIEGSMDREIKKTARKKTAGKIKVFKRNSNNNSIKSDSLDVSESITVKEICEKTGVSPAKLIGELMKNGIIANIKNTPNTVGNSPTNLKEASITDLICEESHEIPLRPDEEIDA